MDLDVHARVYTRLREEMKTWKLDGMTLNAHLTEMLDTWEAEARQSTERFRAILET